jgi:hypothetical protein
MLAGIRKHVARSHHHRPSTTPTDSTGTAQDHFPSNSQDLIWGLGSDYGTCGVTTAAFEPTSRCISGPLIEFDRAFGIHTLQRQTIEALDAIFAQLADAKADIPTCLPTA